MTEGRPPARRRRTRRRRTGARSGTVAGGYRHPPPSVQIVDRYLRARPGSVDLATSYELCRRLNAAHGRTYYLATRLLPAGKRPHVHALYGFARYADDLVDHLDLSWSPERRRVALEEWSGEFLRSLVTGRTDDPVLVAVLHTVQTLRIRHDDLRAFLASMAMDVTVRRYETWDDLHAYVYGSAAVIGSMMLPVLGARDPRARARAMDLGIAFQLTNFLRDVAEDWDRGRIYLPMEDLRRFGVTEADFRARRVTPGFRRLLAFEIDRTRDLYARAEHGWTMLDSSSRWCVRVAHRLYAGILEGIEAADYQVFDVRAAVPAPRKLAIALGELARPSRPGDRVAGGTVSTVSERELAVPAVECHHGGLGVMGRHRRGRTEGPAGRNESE